MSGLITLAVAGGATGITVALLVWWIVRTVRDSERRASDAIVKLEKRNTSDANERADKAVAASARWEKMYAAERQAFLAFARRHIDGASDADVLRLAGGDPGPIANGLLEPDWSTTPVSDGAMPEPR